MKKITYNIRLKGSNGKEYLDSYDNLRQDLGICKLSTLSQQDHQKLNSLSNILFSFIKEYFKLRILEFTENRTKLFRLSFVIESLEHYGLWRSEKWRAIDELIDDGIFEKKSRGWFRRKINE